MRKHNGGIAELIAELEARGMRIAALEGQVAIGCSRIAALEAQAAELKQQVAAASAVTASAVAAVEAARAVAASPPTVSGPASQACPAAALAMADCEDAGGRGIPPDGGLSEAAWPVRGEAALGCGAATQWLPLASANSLCVGDVLRYRLALVDAWRGRMARSRRRIATVTKLLPGGPAGPGLVLRHGDGSLDSMEASQLLELQVQAGCGRRGGGAGDGG
mmetsp:Transcript_91906/g.279218  ORF Transcript_91906/g.279218 Transcript_91906/m.279218 type:complete len:220 (-) Transcript_91906:22-681(-)